MGVAFLLIPFLVSLVLLRLGLVVSKTSYQLFNKPSSFECGFEEISSARMSFSLKFFLVVLVFLVFDVEVALLLPMPLGSTIGLNRWGLCSTMILIILIAELYIEIQQGRLR